MADILTLLWAVLVGVFGGASYGALGYIKSKAKTGSTEKFDPTKLIASVLLGAIIGGAAGYMGADYTTAQATFENWSMSGGIVMFVDFASKAIWRSMSSRKPAAVAGKKGKKKTKPVAAVATDSEEE